MLRFELNRMHPFEMLALSYCCGDGSVHLLRKSLVSCAVRGPVENLVRGAACGGRTRARRDAEGCMRGPDAVGGVVV